MKRLGLLVAVLLACSALPAARAQAQYDRGSILGPMITPDATDAEVPSPEFGEDVPSSPGRLHWGRLAFLPRLGFSTTYDDNVFLGSGQYSILVEPMPGGGQLPILNEARIGDVVFQFTPALALNLPLKGKRGRAGVGYVGDFALYADRSDNNWDRQVVNFDFEYATPSGFSLVLRNNFTDTSDPFGSLDQYELGVKKRRWFDTLTPTAGYRFSRRFRSFLYYEFFNQKYIQLIDYSQNYRYSRVGPGFEVLVMPKTWAFARYFFLMKDYYTDAFGVTPTNNASNDRHRVDVGLTWDATSKITGELNVGWEWILYDNTRDVAGLLYSNKNLPVVNTALNYEFSPRTVGTLYISREWREIGANTNDAFASTGVGINLSHGFFEKYQARAGFGYANDDYNDPDYRWIQPVHTPGQYYPPYTPGQTMDDRNDNNYSTALSLSYQIQDWLRVGVTYNLYAKVSNYEQYSFVDNKGTLWLVGAY